jgi:hypothetical protein
MLSFLMLSSLYLLSLLACPIAPRDKTPRPIISPANPVESTLPIPPLSVHSKPLTVAPFSLESTLTKKRGRGASYC